VRRSSGFTIVEIIVVLLLMSILAATLLGRSVTTTDLYLNSATDKVRNQLRFAQAEAMKRSDTVWGVNSFGTEYWLFRNTTANEERIPGGDYPGAGNRINKADLGVGVTLSDFTVFFDRIGKPYTAYTSPTVNTPLAIQMPITVSVSGDNRTITITPETGLIR
jgi:prepilin-type N-terminal cleavage/methylation domain-containing protein